MDIGTLVKRARLQNIMDRATDLDTLRAMLTGEYEPRLSWFMPPFKIGTARHAAWNRAVRTTSTTVPVIIGKSIAGVDFGSLTWGDANANPEGVDDALALVNLNALARDLAVEFRIAGVAAVMAHTPMRDGHATEPVLRMLHGLNVPYADARDPSRITGWYHAIEYSCEEADGELRWWVEVYDWEGIPDGDPITHRVWKSLRDPTALGHSPDDEYQSTARPRFMIAGSAPDGMPVSPLVANMGRILGLYATELRLATTEELSAFPMLLTKGDADVDAVGPAETIAVSEQGDARWMDPGKLDELREQVRLRRDQVREAFNLPGGALGAQTPSGEALKEANRGFMQETRALTDALSALMTSVTHDYLNLLELQPVDVSVSIDREYTTGTLLEVIEKGMDLGLVPKSVAARAFQTFIGNDYSDDELAEFLEEEEARKLMQPAGFLNPLDDRDRDGEEDAEVDA